MKKTQIYLGIILLVVILGISFAQAGWFSNIITGRGSDPINVNLNISTNNQAPEIREVISNTILSPVGLTETNFTNATIYLIVFDNDLNTNINVAGAIVNVTKPGEITKIVTGCTSTVINTKTLNLSCIVGFWYFEAGGNWNIGASVPDNSGGIGYNTTGTIYLPEVQGFVASPVALAWDSLSPGAVNQSSINDPILMNNTGNALWNISINSTDLLGESVSTYGLYANNFSVGISDPACDGTTMIRSDYANIIGATLPKGNYSINNGTSGQEQLYFCLKKVGAELPSQAYSTNSTGPWVIKGVLA